MIENFNPFISLGGDNQKVNHMAEAALEMNLTCNDLKKDLNLTDGDVVDMLQLVMDRFKTVSYTHLRAHETRSNLVCRLLLEKKK